MGRDTEHALHVHCILNLEWYQILRPLPAVKIGVAEWQVLCSPAKFCAFVVDQSNSKLKVKYSKGYVLHL